MQDCQALAVELFFQGKSFILESSSKFKNPKRPILQLFYLSI
jgi:hypothetical protein